ncbi:MAG: LysM peptidoglycan-binding domain-containing protein [Methylophilaceae bacterium]
MTSKTIFIVGILLSAILMPSAYAESNLADEDILILGDDNLKSAPRILSDKELKDLITKNTLNERNGSAFENQLNEAANAQPDIIIINNDDLWQRIKSGYAMPDSTSNLVERHENWYSTRPDYVKRMVERSQRYLFHIVEEVEKRGMPTEIALLPMIESAYNPQAYSSGRASGIWQFIPSTGKHFGLRQDWWVDNRRNITFATDAALTYLQKLHAMFGAWDLALAAYNAGEGTVGRAIEKNRKLGLPTDYESLNLPPETKNYVPKLQAIKNLMTNPGNYGLKIQTIANTPYFAKVSAPAQIDAHLAAKLAEITDSEFLALNPSYNRPVITGGDDKHELLLPIIAAQAFRTNLAGYNKPLVSWKTYFAKRGERMESIASKFGIKLGQLRDVNDLPDQKKIRNSSTILVPINSDGVNAAKAAVADTKISVSSIDIVKEASKEVSSEQNSANIDLSSADSKASHQDLALPSKQHSVKKGESLMSIAKQYDTSVKEIMALNSLKNKHVKTGQLLMITSAAPSIESANTKKIATKAYTVKPGDTVYSIAQKHAISVADLKRWNSNMSDQIQPGQKLNFAPNNAS